MALALTAGLTVGWRHLPPAQLEQFAAWIIGLGLLAIVMPLGWRAAAVVLVGSAGVQFGLSRINEAKIAMTQAPLTVLDFEIALANPRGLWLALGLPVWTRVPVGVLLVALLGGVAALGGWLSWRHVRRQTRQQRIGTGVSVALSMAGLVWYTVALPGALAPHADQNDELWEAAGLSAYSSRIGVVPFLLYSYQLERGQSGPYYTEKPVAPTPPATIRATANTFVSLSRRPRTLPNIVIVFAESTFNPDWAFHLSEPVASELFAHHADTHVLTGMTVNTVGGGSWITEFETVVGVDARLFGYAGNYTHATLSPFIRHSLATYLKGKGYDTAAYYSWAGDFYNARRAYGHYGFGQFFDVTDIGLHEFEGSDVDVATAALARITTAQAAPRFAYVVLYENHSPHACEHFTDAAQLPVTFAGSVEFGKNCELNEYLLRMASTTAAVETVEAALKDMERTTGRPYVLAVFGDHQPHTFTGTKAPPLSNFDYVAERTGDSMRNTFLHIRSSAPNPLRCCGTVPPPAFLLPTLLSAYVATGVDDLYLPQNFQVYQQCGSDILADNQARKGAALPLRIGPPPQPGCRPAYLSWLSSIRKSGVM